MFKLYKVRCKELTLKRMDDCSHKKYYWWKWKGKEDDWKSYNDWHDWNQQKIFEKIQTIIEKCYKGRLIID